MSFENRNYSKFYGTKLNQTLREIRKLNKMSQQQIADILEIHRSTYSYYETGKTEPHVKMILALCEIYHTTVNDMLNREPIIQQSKIVPKTIKVNLDGAVLSQYEKNFMHIISQMDDSQRLEVLLHSMQILGIKNGKID